MSIGTWVIVGLLAGFLASKLVLRTGDGLMRDLGLGIAGAVLTGGIFGMISGTQAAGPNVFGLVVVFAGASTALIVYHTLFPRISSR
ncbi:MAG: GlsB/YeaQ/YmgE family stress response membrane protein [Burkholderiales bacterium]|nr:GlsB/YeaQ/YmgE family stress response membrane protein [Burkholderiales bacterium]